MNDLLPFPPLLWEDVVRPRLYAAPDPVPVEALSYIADCCQQAWDAGRHERAVLDDLAREDSPIGPVARVVRRAMLDDDGALDSPFEDLAVAVHSLEMADHAWDCDHPTWELERCGCLDRLGDRRDDAARTVWDLVCEVC